MLFLPLLRREGRLLNCQSPAAQVVPVINTATEAPLTWCFAWWAESSLQQVAEPVAHLCQLPVLH